MSTTDVRAQDVFMPGFLLPAGQYRADMYIYNSLNLDPIMTIKTYLTIPSTKSLLDLSMG